MCALDRRERPLNSQSVNKYILNVQNIYRNSPVPVCVRNKNRKILYANGAFIELFSREDKPLSGESYIRLQGDDSNLLIVFYVQIMPDDFVMQLHRF